jgi:glycosyltransferase involved in cell wall biosynthesis
MPNAPLVSVVMAVYNGENYLEEAVQSILDQTFRDFEFIIINDGSTDDTPQILQRKERSDFRISTYHQENRGLISSLNRGCRLSKGKYIARMDADDISLPDRFEKQANYLEEHPEIGVLGTWVKIIDEDGVQQSSWKYPSAPSLVEWTLLFRDCVAHPSVMMRREALLSLDFYRPEALHVEDYDLWARATTVTQIANLPQFLYIYRAWDGNICSRFSKIQQKNITGMIMPLMIERLLGHEVPHETLVALRQISMDSPIENRSQTKAVGKIIRDLRKAYLRKNALTPVEGKKISKDAGERLYALASFASKSSMLQGLKLYVYALGLQPQLFSLHFIKKFMRRRASHSIEVGR